MIEVSTRGSIGILKLNRPEARNALSRPLIAAMTEAVNGLETNPEVRVILLAGGPPFCAGADISDMGHMSVIDALIEDFSGCCDRLATCRKPLVAAVEGYALGGGCELIEMCDIVIAARDARIGHPEITLGTLSGAGGTQRLARAVGRAKAMDLILTGRLIAAPEAEGIGLISRVVEPGTAYEQAIQVAMQVAQQPLLAAGFAKEAVHRAVSVGLEDGLRLERRLFQLSFCTEEFHRGIKRFMAKRKF